MAACGPARLTIERHHGAGTAIQPDGARTPLNGVSGWTLDRLIRDFARFINSDVALLYGLGVGGSRPR
jgi:hypothetical protein